MAIIDTIKKKIGMRTARKNAQAFVTYLIKEQNLNISEAYLFGSYARGEQRKWSDVDVCVVSPYFKTEDGISYLWRKRRNQDVDNQIEPLGFHDEEFNENTPSPIIHEIKKTGIRLI